MVIVFLQTESVIHQFKFVRGGYQGKEEFRRKETKRKTLRVSSSSNRRGREQLQTREKERKAEKAIPTGSSKIHDRG